MTADALARAVASFGVEPPPPARAALLAAALGAQIGALARAAEDLPSGIEPAHYAALLESSGARAGEPGARA